jgi:hypothetical protein
MKKLTSILLFFSFALPNLHAQQTFGTRNNTFKVNIISPFFNTLNMAYNRRLSEDKAIQFGAAFMNYHDENSSRDNRTIAQFFYFEYRYSIDVKGIEQIYIAPFGRFINLGYTETINTQVYDSNILPIRWRDVTYDNKSQYQSFGLGFVIGKEFVFKDRISIDFFAGPVYGFLLNKSENYSPLHFSSGMGRPSQLLLNDAFSSRLLEQYSVRAGVNVGIKF